MGVHTGGLNKGFRNKVGPIGFLTFRYTFHVQFGNIGTARRTREREEVSIYVVLGATANRFGHRDLPCC